MRRVVTLVVAMLVLPWVCHGAGYVCVNYALGGKIDGPSLGIEMGGVFLSDLHPQDGALSVGIGISVADTDDDPPSADTPPVQQPTYSAQKEYNDGYEQEVSLVLGAELIPAFFAVLGVGYASQDTVLVGTTAGNQHYKLDTETDTNVSLMLGMRYVLRGLNMGLGFHTRRGVMVSLGIAF
ncbi:MAG: hypothetical protein RRA35_01835 [Desulfomonilia bacterium]|nr:hypothetical protein [Desulfomonilia bacterium]